MQMDDLLQSIKSDGINPRYLSKVKDEFNFFIEGKEVNSNIVPEEIINSWTRSRSYGVNPYDQSDTIVDSSKKKELENFQDLIRRYEFYFKNVSELVQFNDYIFSFAAKDSINQIILNKTGHSLPNCVGDCSEKVIGTTGSTIALWGNEPTIILPQFYYCQMYMKKNFGEVYGSSAPIHNEREEVIGSLSLGFRDPERTVQAYYLISLIAKMFDKLYLPLKHGYEKQIQQIINCLPQGIACMNETDTVKFYNEKILDLLKVDRKMGIENELNKHLSQWGVGAEFYKEIKVNVGGKVVEAQSLYNEMKNEITEQTFKLIQIEAKIGSDKYTTKKLKGDELFTFDHIIGNSPSIKKAKAIAMDVAETSVPVMIYGESGTGKEMFAQAIHRASPRCDGAFVAINCGAIPGELVESELFGYEEGSFTGALKGGKIGKIEAASGGTLFLDEIESMPLKDQIKLLRVLSTGKIQKIGSTKEICIDVRLISATKTDLLKQADDGLFREDLFYRISTFIIGLPPLRERKGDIIVLAEEFINKLEKKYHLSKIEMDWTFINALCSYHWRGNVRELEHAMERAVIVLHGGQKLCNEHLSDKIQDAYQKNTTDEIVEQVLEQSENRQGLLALAEKMLIERVLKSVHGNVSAAAEQLGINRRTIYKKMQGENGLEVTCITHQRKETLA